MHLEVKVKQILKKNIHFAHFFSLSRKLCMHISLELTSNQKL